MHIPRSSRTPTHVVVGRLLAVAVAILALGFVLRDVDWAESYALLRRLGPAVLWIFVPQAVAMTLDAFAWRHVLRRLSVTVRLWDLWTLTCGASAVLMSVFLGAVLTETVKARVLQVRYGIAWAVTLASLALRKRLIVWANGLVVLAAVVLGHAVVRDFSLAFFGSPHPLFVLLLGASAALFFAASMGSAIVRRQRFAGALHRVLVRVPIASLRRWAARERMGFEQTDSAVSSALSLSPRVTWWPTAVFVLQWMTEAAETYLLLWLLGVDVDFVQALVLETSISLMRSLAFVLPGGIGVTDVGYVIGLKTMGVVGATEVALAFVLLKRMKDIGWIMAGYGVLLMLRKKGEPTLGAAP